MSFIDRLFRKPSQPLRAVVATKSENLAAQRAATVKFKTPEQRFKRIERKAFAGMALSPLKVGKA